MKKSLFGVVLTILIVTNVFSYETPTKSVKAEDMIDKQLPKMDKTIWQNLLQFYANVRMIAKTTLEDMQAISNFAWSAQRQLQSVENAAKRIDQIYRDIKNYRGDNPVDFIMFAELRVFRQTDALKDFDIPMIIESNEQLIKDRDEIVKLGKDQAKAVANVSVKGYKWFEEKFFFTQRNAQPDLRTVDDACPRPGQAMAKMGGALISENLAGADIRNQNLQNQNAMLSALAGAAGCNEGDVPTKVTAGVGKDNNRNGLILALQENDLQSAAIKNEAWYLMIKARQIDQAVVSKSLLVMCATEFTDAVNKVRADERFIGRK